MLVCRFWIATLNMTYFISITLAEVLILFCSCLIQGKNRLGTLLLAYKTLGVVFGGLVTSPLYVYPSIPLKSPTEDDYLGLYSIMFWTLTLIGVVKYACIALKADDHGEGIRRINFLTF